MTDATQPVSTGTKGTTPAQHKVDTENLHGDDLMDIYIRFSADYEKDYCFSVARTAKVESLMAIFKTLPMVLSPSYFYDPQPIGFGLSVQPGFLTSEGALLFHADAHEDKFVKKIDQQAEIGQVAFEGQLFVPIWAWNQSRFLTMSSIFLVWLYLDLPDCISPTPEHQPTVLLTKLAEKLIPSLAGQSLVSEDAPFGNIYWQWGFFAFHVLKCALLFTFLYIGGVNPFSFNPIASRRLAARRKEITRQDLLDIGWTSVRRATPQEWKEENRKHKIEAYGGIMKAYQAGILSSLPSAGLYLHKGEGWDSAPGAKPADDKYVVDKAYFAELYKFASTHCSKLKDEEALAYFKAFRRSGPLDGPEDLVARYKVRKSFDPEEREKRAKEEKEKKRQEEAAAKLKEKEDVKK